VNFVEFHNDELPRRILAGNGRLAAAGTVGLAGIAFEVDGASYTYLSGPDGVEVVAGDERAACVVAMSAVSWGEFVEQMRTVPSLLYTGMLSPERGDVELLLRWEQAIRALHHGLPVFVPGELDLRDKDGGRLDIEQVFPADVGAAELGFFIREAGFAVVRGVFSADEIAVLRADADSAVAAARQGDRRSWWARSAEGETRLCRVTYANLSCPTIATICDDPRVRRLVAAFDDSLLPGPDRLDGIAIIIKNPDIADGLSDLPWHVDCGMGGHALLCPVVQVSVLLEPANPDTGTLKFLAGSHRFACSAPAAQEEAGLPVVTVAGEPGDLLMHLGDTMHAAPAPLGRGSMRRSLVTSFYQPAVLDVIEEGCGFNDVLLSNDDGHVDNLADVVRGTPSEKL